MDKLTPIIGWLSPILSTLIVTALTAQINAHTKRREQREDEEREERAAWREKVVDRLDEQDAKVDAVLKGQCTQMRSDLIHKAHRYIDDLGAAGTEEKQAFWAEYEDYQALCDAYHIKNSFVDHLAEQVMALSTREERSK